eukprot:gene4841-22779_t
MLRSPHSIPYLCNPVIPASAAPLGPFALTTGVERRARALRANTCGTCVPLRFAPNGLGAPSGCVAVGAPLGTARGDTRGTLAAPPVAGAVLRWESVLTADPPAAPRAASGIATPRGAPHPSPHLSPAPGVAPAPG